MWYILHVILVVIGELYLVKVKTLVFQFHVSGVCTTPYLEGWWNSFPILMRTSINGKYTTEYSMIDRQVKADASSSDSSPMRHAVFWVAS